MARRRPTFKKAEENKWSGEVLQLVTWHHVMTCWVALLTYDGSVEKRFCPCDAAWWLLVEGWPAVMTWWSEELWAFHVYGLGDFFKLSFIIKWIIILYCVWTTVLVFSLTQTHLELIFKSCVNDCCCILSLTCDWKNISLFSLKKK